MLKLFEQINRRTIGASNTSVRLFVCWEKQMKEIALTQGKVALVDDEDFEELNKHKWYYLGIGYAQRHWGILMHRVILQTPKGKFTDHINGNRCDNRKCNLRTVDCKQNAYNSKLSKRNKCGYKGVDKMENSSSCKKPWRATVNRIYLGLFATKEEAALAYNKAAKKYYGEFARLNVIPIDEVKLLKGEK